MRIGRFEIKKHYEEGKPFKWAVMGRNDRGQLVVCFDDTRRPKELLFDLQYDACGYLQGFVEWMREDYESRKLTEKIQQAKKQSRSGNSAKKTKNRAKAKLAKQARKKNR
jgi:hypothetical protein